MSVPYFLSSEGLAFRSLESPTKGIPLDKNFYPVMILLYSFSIHFFSIKLSGEAFPFFLFQKMTRILPQVYLKTNLNRTGFSREGQVISVQQNTSHPDQQWECYFTFLWGDSCHKHLPCCDKTQEFLISQTVVMMMHPTFIILCFFTPSMPILQAQLPAKKLDYITVRVSHTATLKCCEMKDYF